VPAPVAGDGHADGGRPPVVVAPASGVAAPNVPAVGAGPADVVGAALFLSSPAARLVTGQVIAVGLPVD
jgi:NAD(P)-dependent dehydrogenase (short-subunit alcohol dehydrogenase family)